MQQSSKSLQQQDVQSWVMRPRSYAAVTYRIPFGTRGGKFGFTVIETDQPGGTNLNRLQRLASLEVVLLLHRIMKVAPAVEEAHAVFLTSIHRWADDVALAVFSGGLGGQGRG